MAGPHDVQLARLYVARERNLAGLPNKDPKGPDYPAVRASYLAEFKRRTALLLENGLGSKEQYDLEWEALEKDFPEP